jgi:hypothetical protein
MMKRLKPKEVQAFRQALAEKQGLVCALCGRGLPLSGGHLDHCHKTGLIRGVLHGECNTLLGKIENFFNTFGKNMDQEAFLSGVQMYLDKPHTDVYHHTFRTEDEKRLSRNLKARLRRKK